MNHYYTATAHVISTTTFSFRVPSCDQVFTVSWPTAVAGDKIAFLIENGCDVLDVVLDEVTVAEPVDPDAHEMRREWADENGVDLIPVI